MAEPLELPTPDDVVFDILENVLHISPVVLGLIAIALSIKSWIETISTGRTYARRAARAAAGGLAYAAERGGFKVAITTSALILCAQVLVLPIAFLYGNVLSIQVDMLVSGDDSLRNISQGTDYGQRLVQYVRIWDEGGWSAPFSPTLYSSLRVDTASLASIAVYVGGVLASYRSAAKYGRVDVGPGFVASLPFSFYVYPAIAGLAITAFNRAAFGSGLGRSGSELNFLLGVSLACAAYIAICVVVTKASRISALMWTPAARGR